MKKLIILQIISSYLALVSCKDNGGKQVMTQDGRFLVRTTYKNNNIEREEYFSGDTTVRDGPEVTFYPNGNVKKWEWFKNNFQLCNVYYFENKNFDTCQGTPFIDTHFDESFVLWVRTIKIPYFTDIRLGYKDYKDDTLLKEFAYKYKATDTGLFFPLLDHKPEKGHVYVLTYYIFDDNHPIYKSDITLQNDAEKK